MFMIAAKKNHSTPAVRRAIHAFFMPASLCDQLRKGHFRKTSEARAVSQINQQQKVSKSCQEKEKFSRIVVVLC